MNPFVESERLRLRAFWRLAIHFVGFLFLQILFVTIAISLWTDLGPASMGGGTGESNTTINLVFGTLGSLVGTTLSVWLAGRFLDRRPFRDFGLKLDGGWWLDLAFGLLLGAGLMAAIFLVQLSLGWVTVVMTFDPGFPETPFVLGILPPLVVFLCVGFYEELVSRGYQMKNISEGLAFLGGPRVAILIAWLLTSGFFGVLHLGNPNTTAISTANIALAGILLGVGYVLTGQLAIPIGVHITWNFFQGSVFGFPVSGLTIPGGSFVRINQSGPELWTGGPFGPEAGLLVPIAIATGFLLTCLWVRFRYGRLGIFTAIAKPPEPVGKSTGSA